MMEQPCFSEVYCQYRGFRDFKVSAECIPEKKIPILGCLFWDGDGMEKQHFLQELTVART